MPIPADIGGKGCLARAKMRRTVYLDNNATTPCAPEVVEGMLECFSSNYGNPSSSHIMGRRAMQCVEDARGHVADSIGADPTEIVFTSGATESNNLAMLGVGGGGDPSRKRILVSAVEHKSVLGPGGILAQMGFVIEEVPVDSTGLVRVEALQDRLGPDVLLVSIQAASNEVGTLQPMGTLAQVVHEVGALVHCDAAQAMGKIPFDVSEFGVDMASLSGHKVYGPKGVGALFIKRGLAGSRVVPILGGGGQESGLRPGTLNVPGIVGMGIACGLAQSRLSQDMAEIARLRNLLEERLLAAVPGARINGNLTSRLPGTSSITFPGVPADALIANVPEVCVSTGSACTSGAVAPSHVLLAMGLSRDEAECTIRIGVGRYTTREDVEAGASLLSKAALGLRSHR
jgi:cysteine desulfurase